MFVLPELTIERIHCSLWYRWWIGVNCILYWKYKYSVTWGFVRIGVVFSAVLSALYALCWIVESIWIYSILERENYGFFNIGKHTGNDANNRIKKYSIIMLVILAKQKIHASLFKFHMQQESNFIYHCHG